MNNIINAQTNAKTFLKRVSIMSAIVLVLSITLSNAFAVPPHGNFNNNKNCNTDLSKTLVQRTCCWFENVEPGTGNPGLGGNQEEFCQTCSQVYQGGGWIWDCDPAELQFRTAPLTDESIFPHDNGKILDEQQPNPNPPLTDQRVPLGNVGTLEPLEESSNNENSESENSQSNSDSIENAFTQQESDDSSNSEESLNSNDNETGGSNALQ